MTKKIPPQLAEQEDVNSNAKHDFIFQFVDHETGLRSQPFLSDWTQLQEVLAQRTEETPKPTDDDYILLVAVMDSKQTHIPTSPLLTVGTYLEKVAPINKEAS